MEKTPNDSAPDQTECARAPLAAPHGRRAGILTMTGTITFEQDSRRLTEQVSALKAWLMGTGATDGACKDMLKVEAGQLAWEISEQLGPRTLPEGKAGVEKDVSRVFFPMSDRVPFFTGRKTGTQADFQWLFAYGGGDGNPSFLVGADSADIIGDKSADLRDILYDKARQNRGSRWHDLGEFSHEAPDSTGRQRRHFKRWRGNQHAIKINRVVVSTAAYQRLIRMVQAQLGQLRASFARTAEAFNARKRIPKWVSDQISETVWNGKSIFNDAGLNHPTEPWIEFGSHAKGVESNPVIAQKIHAAFVQRSYAMAGTLKRLTSGAKYVWETGATYFPKAGGDQ